MWTQEECCIFFTKVFGLEFTSIELEAIWTHLSQNHLTPVSRHGGNNVGFTPLMLRGLINLALLRTNSTLRDSRFKKVSEEIMPAFTFVLLLKRVGLGEHLIVSSDVPDIALVDFDRNAVGEINRRVGVLPVEAIFLPPDLIKNSSGDSVAEKIANVVINRKFTKRYIPQTILLITLSGVVENLNHNDLSGLFLCNNYNFFHQIWIFFGADGNNLVMARLTPDFQLYELNVDSDLLPLIY